MSGAPSRFTLCPSCGTKLRADRAKCPRCGTRFGDAKPAFRVPRWSWAVAAGVAALLIATPIIFRPARPAPAPAGVSSSLAKSPPTTAAAPAVSVEGARVSPDGHIPFLDPSRAGTVAYTRGDYQGALARFEYAVAANPQDAEALSNLGQMLVRLGRPAEAVPRFERAIALNGSRWAYHFNLARASGLLREWDRAIAGYRRAAQLYPDDYATLFNLGLALHKKGDEAAAVEEYKRAIALSPSDASFHLALASSYDRLTRATDAIAAYARFLELAPTSPQAAQVQTRVRQLISPAPPAPSAASAVPPAGPGGTSR